MIRNKIAGTDTPFFSYLLTLSESDNSEREESGETSKKGHAEVEFQRLFVKCKYIMPHLE